MTIIYYDDWKKNGGKPNWETTNTSAIRMATVFKKMGLQNHAFHLALYDQDLRGIDPFDETLTATQQAKVTKEFGKNLWFAIRECIRIPPIAGIDPIPFRFHRANISMYWLYMNDLFSINVISRQRGKTMAVICLFTWLLNSRYSMKISSISKDDDLRGEIIRTFKQVYECLPPYLQFRDSSDSRNLHEFTVNALKNLFKMAVPSTSPKRAYLIGRGLTTSTTWSEEGCFSPNIRISLGACIASGTYAREEAQARGQPNGIIMTTTAGLIDDQDAGYIYELAMASTPFTEHMYDLKDKDTLHRTVRANNSRGILRVYAVFNHLQLGVSNARQVQAIQMAAQSDADTERDFLSIWNRGGSGHPLPASILSVINTSVREASYIEIDPTENYIVNWYVPEEAIDEYLSEPVILSLDPSEIIGVDSMGLVIQRAEDGAVIATANQSLASIPSYIRWLYKTFFRPYPSLIGIIENRMGQAIIDGLVELMVADGINPFLRLFNQIVQNADVHKDKWDMIRPPRFRPADKNHIRFKKLFGFKTSGAGDMARSTLYGEVFFAASKECGSRMYDHMLVAQLAGLFEKNGRIDHPAGGHDDLVIAWLLGQWFLRNGKNVNQYGFDQRSILRNTNPKTLVTYEDRRNAEQRELYRELLETLSDTDCVFIQQRLIRRIRGLELSLDTTSEPTTLEAVLDEMKNMCRVT